MKKEEMKNYKEPVVKVVNVKLEGVLCSSKDVEVGGGETGGLE